MHALLILDTHRHPASIQAFNALCRHLRWQQSKNAPTFVFGADEITTLSLTQEDDALFYNADEFLSLSMINHLQEQEFQSITYLHQGYLWQRLQQHRWRFIHHPHLNFLGSSTLRRR